MPCKKRGPKAHSEENSNAPDGTRTSSAAYWRCFEMRLPWDNAPFRDVFLGNDEKLVDDQSVATFDSTKVSQSNWNRLADKDYFVTINVVSARKASKNNLLWCGVPENRLSTFAGKTTEVSCGLIDEHFPVLKSLGSSPK
jgi:hypothetical protein